MFYLGPKTTDGHDLVYTEIVPVLTAVIQSARQQDRVTNHSPPFSVSLRMSGTTTHLLSYTFTVSIGIHLPLIMDCLGTP